MKSPAIGACGLTQEKIADSYTQITQFRLHVLYAAWLIDKHKVKMKGDVKKNDAYIL